MRNTIHPAAQTRAAKHGARILIAEGGFRLQDLKTELLSALTYDMVAECGEALEDKRNPVEWEQPKPEAKLAGNRSGVMVKRYHDAYSKNPHGPGCGDGLDIAMRDATYTTPEGEKTPRVDVALLKAIGVQHGLWNPAWQSFNPGMQRMNLTNRLRAHLRRSANHEITLDGETGRFGVAVKPPKGKAPKAAKEPKTNVVKMARKPKIAA